MNSFSKNKYKKLLLSIGLDAIGYVSFIFPPFDFVWAPLSAYLMTRLYKGKKGRIAAVVSFIEEAIPMLDVIPTFTLMWLYTFVFSSTNEEVIVNSDKINKNPE